MTRKHGSGGALLVDWKGNGCSDGLVGEAVGPVEAEQLLEGDGGEALHVAHHGGLQAVL